MTQAQLAEGVDKSVQLIGRIERGLAAPSFETLELLARALSVEVRDLFGTGSMAAGRDDPLAQLVQRVAGLSDADLRWVTKLIEVALSRKSLRGVG